MIPLLQDLKCSSDDMAEEMRRVVGSNVDQVSGSVERVTMVFEFTVCAQVIQFELKQAGLS